MATMMPANVPVTEQVSGNNRLISSRCQYRYFSVMYISLVPIADLIFGATCTYLCTYMILVLKCR